MSNSFFEARGVGIKKIRRYLQRNFRKQSMLNSCSTPTTMCLLLAMEDNLLWNIFLMRHGLLLVYYIFLGDTEALWLHNN